MFLHRTMRGVVCAFWILTTASCANAAVSFTNLYWAPENPHSFCYNTTGVSGDGSVVVGTGGIHQYEGGDLYYAFRWTAGSGTVGLDNSGYSFASGVSADGSVIVGASDGYAVRSDRWRGHGRTGLLPAGWPG